MSKVDFQADLSDERCFCLPHPFICSFISLFNKMHSLTFVLGTVLGLGSLSVRVRVSFFLKKCFTYFLLKYSCCTILYVTGVQIVIHNF